MATGCTLAFGAGAASLDYASYVNPFIGTTNFGTTNPGAVRPNGLMSVTPFNVMGPIPIPTTRIHVGGLPPMMSPISFLPVSLM